MAVFGFEILGVKPRNFLGFEPNKKSTSKSGFELYSAICNCWLIKSELSRQPNPKLNSDFSVIAEPNLKFWIENWKQNAGLKIPVSNPKLMLDFSGFQTQTWKQPFLVYFNRPSMSKLSPSTKLQMFHSKWQVRFRVKKNVILACFCVIIVLTFNKESGSVTNIITLCEMEICNFLWLIWDHYLHLALT